MVDGGLTRELPGAVAQFQPNGSYNHSRDFSCRLHKRAPKYTERREAVVAQSRAKQTFDPESGRFEFQYVSGSAMPLTARPTSRHARILLEQLVQRGFRTS